MRTGYRITGNNVPTKGLFVAGRRPGSNIPGGDPPDVSTYSLTETLGPAKFWYEMAWQLKWQDSVPASPADVTRIAFGYNMKRIDTIVDPAVAPTEITTSLNFALGNNFRVETLGVRPSTFLTDLTSYNYASGWQSTFNGETYFTARMVFIITSLSGTYLDPDEDVTLYKKMYVRTRKDSGAGDSTTLIEGAQALASAPVRYWNQVCEKRDPDGTVTPYLTSAQVIWSTQTITNYATWLYTYSGNYNAGYFDNGQLAFAGTVNRRADGNEGSLTADDNTWISACPAP